MELAGRRFEPTLYPVELDVQYRVTSAKHEWVGTGRTVLMSSKELLFDTEQTVARNSRMEVSICWPVLLDERVRLQLVIQARVTSVEGKRVRANVGKYYFRTRGNGTSLLQIPVRFPLMAPASTHAATVSLRAHA